MVSGLMVPGFRAHEAVEHPAQQALVGRRRGDVRIELAGVGRAHADDQRLLLRVRDRCRQRAQRPSRRSRASSLSTSRKVDGIVTADPRICKLSVQRRAARSDGSAVEAGEPERGKIVARRAPDGKVGAQQPADRTEAEAMSREARQRRRARPTEPGASITGSASGVRSIRPVHVRATWQAARSAARARRARPGRARPRRRLRAAWTPGSSRRW